MENKLKFSIIGTIVTVILILSGISIGWYFDKDHTTLKRDGVILAEHRWHVEAERTYISKNSWYRRNIICPRLISEGGYETATRCYYPDDTYEQLSRSLLRTYVSLLEPDVTRDTPYYKYGTAGAYAGYLTEVFKFMQTKSELDFPDDYITTWEPKDTRNYRLVWRVWNLKDFNLSDGEYHDCTYHSRNTKIDLKEDCKDLEKAVVKGGDTIWFYFKPQRGKQLKNTELVDPALPVVNDLEEKQVKFSVVKGTDVIWSIIKTNAEDNLDVTYDIINNTNTDFCVGFIDKQKYNKTLNILGRDIKKVPITKIKQTKNFNIYKSKLDLSKITSNGKECFRINYQKLAEGLQFKIGWDSIIITSNTTAGDGRVQMANADWDTAHDATNGIHAEYTTVFEEVLTAFAGGNYHIKRGFFPINTTLLPLNSSINSANLSVFVSLVMLDDDDAEAFMVVVDTTQLSVSSLVTEDFDEAGRIDDPRELSERIMLSDMSAYTWVDFRLNAAGLNAIKKGGITRLGIREGHDVLDEIFVGNDPDENTIAIMFYENVSHAPFLAINYEINEGNLNAQLLEDATFDEDSTLDGSSFLRVDLIDGTGELIFLKFDIFPIPSGNLVTGASLTLNSIIDSNEPLNIWYVSNQTWIEEEIDDLCNDDVMCTGVSDMFTTLIKVYTGDDNPATPDIITGLANTIQTEIGNGNPNISFAIMHNGTDTNDFYLWYSKEAANGSLIPLLTISHTPDDAPIITLLRNDSTTNVSTDLLWTCSEACNFTISLYNSTEMGADNLTAFVSNNTFISTHQQNISGLMNHTNYYLNLSVWDSTGNEGINDTFNFITQQNAVVAVADTTNPKSNLTANVTTIKINEWMNFTLNVSDEIALSYCWFHSTLNASNSTYLELSGTESQCSYVTQINISQGNQFNITGYVNDTSNNLNSSIFIMTVSNTNATGTVILNATDHPFNYTTANLTCYNTSQSDADGDSLTTSYVWYNDSFKTTITNTFVHSINTTKGQNWTCELNVNDGIDVFRINSTNLTIQNTLPVVTIPIINSTPANRNKTNSTLGCFNTSQFDADSDVLTVTYAWQNNSIETTFTDNYIGLGNTTKNQNWSCIVTVTDGTTSISNNSINLTILNSPPFLNQTIPDLVADSDSSLSVSGVNVTDVDGDSLTYYTNNSIISVIGSVINDTVIPESDAGIYSINISIDDGEVNVSQTISYTITDVTLPIITLLRNDSTTNVSTDILWSCDEACNFTVNIYNASNMIDGNLIVFVSNDTFLTTHIQNISGLINHTDYYLNISVWDDVGNERVNDTFNFTTSRNAPDITPPTITNLRNTSTLNVSVDIEWTCDENCNFTINLYNASDMKAGNLIVSVSNNTFLTSHIQNISGLINFTTYFVNLSVWDTTGNEAINDTFNFTTQQTVGCEDDSGCPTCEKCVDNSCELQTNAEDLKGECTATDCYTGECDGGGSCDIYSGGEEGTCASCTYCDDGDSDCDDMPDNAEDSAGSNLCEGTCVACQVGSCDVADVSTDPDSDCGVSNDCNT